MPVRQNGFVYFVRDEASGLIKIGFTGYDVHSRVRTGQNFNPNPLTIIGFFKGSREDERALHERFRSQCRQMEWFRPNDELLAYIASVSLPVTKATSRCPVCNGTGEKGVETREYCRAHRILVRRPKRAA